MAERILTEPSQWTKCLNEQQRIHHTKFELY
jgi:hypothetical protein